MAASTPPEITSSLAERSAVLSSAFSKSILRLETRTAHHNNRLEAQIAHLTDQVEVLTNQVEVLVNRWSGARPDGLASRRLLGLLLVLPRWAPRPRLRYGCRRQRLPAR
jgi:hypothetical protein